MNSEEVNVVFAPALLLVKGVFEKYIFAPGIVLLLVEDELRELFDDVETVAEGFSGSTGFSLVTFGIFGMFILN